MPAARTLLRMIRRLRAPSLPCLGALGLLAAPGAAAGQGAEPPAVGHEVFAGGEVERYLRVLQGLDPAAAYPWSIRGFSAGEVARLAPTGASHPWAARFRFQADTARGPRVRWVRPRASVVYNSAFPFGGNDGAVWAGRGVTASARGGVAVAYGPVSLVLAPEAFWTQNREFPLFPNGHEGALRFGWREYADEIDLPQRFGDGGYGRVDLGQSTLRVELGPLGFGASTANQVWGPANDHPLLLGNNAPGFPHLFVGTARPLDLWLGRLHGRVVAGRLDQSAYSAMTEGDGRRLMSGLVAVFSPRGLAGLEVGGARFFHAAWPGDGFDPRDLARPFEGIFKSDLFDPDGEGDGLGEENQIASAFVRWVLPGTGFEIYGEIAREDHPWDLRHFLLQPDDVTSYLVGFQHAWRRSDGDVLVVRGEALDTDVSHMARADPIRGQPIPYLHRVQRQGHTQRGQMLSSPATIGGGGGVLAADLYHPSGRWTVSWERVEQAFRTDFVGRDTSGGTGPDVVHAVGVESLRFSRGYDLSVGVAGVYNLNRHFGGGDEFSLRAEVSVHARLGGEAGVGR